MKSVSQHVCAYFDGELTPDGQRTLCAWLLESQEHIDDFVADCMVHTQLIDLFNCHQLRANALLAVEGFSIVAGSHRSRRIIGRILSLAVSLAIVGTVMFLVLTRHSVVATVTGASNAQWNSDAEKQTVGSLLKAGDEISVARGTLRLAFSRGGQVALHGPARFRVDSDISGQLLQGSLSAFVPEHAVGFTVRAKRLKLVDLGTEFHIDLFSDDSSELQVFNGLVEIQFDQVTAKGTERKKLQISQGRAIRFDGLTGSVKTIEYNSTARVPMSEWSQ
jgi:hypothetical protein